MRKQKTTAARSHYTLRDTMRSRWTIDTRKTPNQHQQGTIFHRIGIARRGNHTPFPSKFSLLTSGGDHGHKENLYRRLLVWYVCFAKGRRRVKKLNWFSLLVARRLLFSWAFLLAWLRPFLLSWLAYYSCSRYPMLSAFCCLLSDAMMCD